MYVARAMRLLFMRSALLLCCSTETSVGRAIPDSGPDLVAGG